MACFSSLGIGTHCWPDLSSWSLILMEANLASLPGGLGTGRKGRPQCTSMFQASARVQFANIPGANVHRSHTQLQGWRNSHPVLLRGAAKSCCKG